MHIAYLSSEFITEKLHGGLATYLDNISKIMSGHGHKVTIITLSEQEGKICHSNNVEVIRVCSRSSRIMRETVFGNVLSMLYDSWKLRETILKVDKREKIDIVQAASLQAVVFFRSRKMPTVVRASSDSSLLRNAAKYEFDYNKAIREKTLEDYLELWCVKQADAAFAPSRFCASVIQKRAGREMSVIESPYAEKSIELDESIYQEKLLNKKYLLFNSSLSRLKGTHVGIEAAERLLEKYPDLYMVYAGYDYGLTQKSGGAQSISGILARQSKKYGDRVIYLRHLEHKMLFPIIKHSFACVLPSRVDNLPNSCIEAMALEGIVIGTYGASFEQLIKNKENGLLIKRDSPGALVKAVDWLMNLKEEERFEMGRKAATTIDRLRPEKVYNEMITFYEKVIRSFNKKAK